MRLFSYLTTWATTAVAIWLTSLIVPGIHIESMSETDGWTKPWTFLVPVALVALVYAIINVTLGKIVKFFAVPFVFLTLGILTLFINGALLWATGALFKSWDLGWGLSVADFWSGFWGAIVLGILMWFVTKIANFLTAKR